MNYMGGKMRQGKMVSEFVRRAYRGAEGAPYYEPFAGAMGAALATTPVAKAARAESINLSDVSAPLIVMWLAAMEYWHPPEISKEIWLEAKAARDPVDPLTAYCGFAKSFRGMYFSTFAGEHAAGAEKSVTNKVLALLRASARLRIASFETVRPIGAVMYLDPPYAGRSHSQFSHAGQFDSEAFWRYAAEMVAAGNRVIVTEFAAPAAWIPVFSWGDTVSVKHDKTEGIDERIFVHSSQVDLFKEDNNAAEAAKPGDSAGGGAVGFGG